MSQSFLGSGLSQSDSRAKDTMSLEQIREAAEIGIHTRGSAKEPIGSDSPGGSSSPLREHVAVRIGATLVANLLRAAFSFVSAIMIARGLGAAGYGDLNFLLGSFAAMSQLLDLGTSSAFYTFISQRRRSLSFALIYTGWMTFQF